MFAAWIYMFSFNQFAENVAFRIRQEYFKSCLQKDATYFDNHNPLELVAKINKETHSIQLGIGTKTGQIYMGCFSLIFGFGFAFYWGWTYTLILLAAFPVLASTGAIMGYALESGFADGMKAYS